MIARFSIRPFLRQAHRFALACLGMSAVVLADGSSLAPVHLRSVTNEVEGALVQAIVGLRKHGLDETLREIDRILDRAPNFRLGHLVKGDMLMAQAGRPVAFASNAAPSASVAGLQDEARVRLARYLDAPRLDELPAPVLQLAPSQAHVLLVDTARSRLYVYANDLGRPRYVTDFYISLGANGVEKSREGDQKTPLGVYRVTSRRVSLPDFYGVSAFPIDYPNDWDRLNGRRGHGIWLHGTPSATYSRPPRATDGCVVLANDDLVRLARYVDVTRTPVVIAEALEWRRADALEAARTEFLEAFARWKADWESRDMDRYFSHYATTFRDGGNGLVAWKTYKRRVNAGKAWIKVGLKDVSLFAYPGAKDMIVVSFEQDYRSNNLSNRVHKRQYWGRENGRWRILHETVDS